MNNRKRNPGEGEQDVVVGLDLGTSRTTVVIAERDGHSLNVIGQGTSPSTGLKNGVVVNIEGTVESIINAVEAAERMANTTVNSAYTTISGDHIRSVNSKGMIAVGRSGNGIGSKISREDIHRVIDTARTVTFPADREVLHVVPQDFLVDNRMGFKDPVGIVGLRLEANVHIITAAQAAAQTILFCLQEANIQPEDLVFQALAASQSVLTEDERELGIALIDIGAGTMDIAVYHEGAIRHTAVIGLGGESVTRDLAHGLRIPRNDAENLKLEFGCALASCLENDSPIVLNGNEERPDRSVAPDIVCSVIQPRMEEIYDLAIKELRQADCFAKITAGIVLTGGASMIPGSVELAEEVFTLPARLGKPRGLGCLTEVANAPDHATAIGLVKYGLMQQDSEIRGMRVLRRRRRGYRSKNNRIENIKRWFTDIF
ncbi:cell division protein FtsA [candidate division LCP-89 bacterium B3_LCP]|uniref:Cell division protein FtsA n=1 Tax=candidate division LCP-89 bacterium B3_LCP TaxID=2012998 RepID=A0A532V2S7_UNCL8|nr:MAG: cell division protein FtsA [candidate division LCP-89 bacterium B3_LCP]